LGLQENNNELWAGVVSPAELERMNETARNALRRNAAGYEQQFSIQSLDGSVRNLKEVVRITPLSSVEWELVGVAVDVTEQEQAEQELQKSLSIVSATIESTEDGVLVVNGQGKIIFFNTRFAEMWGIPEHIILSCDDDQAMQFAANLLVDPDSFMKRIEEAYNSDAVFYDILKFKDGRVFERNSHPQRAGTEGSGRVWVFRDISKRTRMEEQLAAANARLIKLVKEDTLTGLLNRRTVLESAELEWSRWQRTHKPFSVLLMDVDDFKRINDQYGHITGDRALKMIADSLRDSIRALDLTGRYGGEEFIVILPETPLEGAIVVAEKMLEGIRQLKLQVNLSTIQLTASIGAAAASIEDKDIDSLIHRADSAMYAAKRGGKNALCAKDSDLQKASLNLASS
jgi:diguanylate cyclase (GGDEF)-like protein/PAS domain S-box-containing protein